eukprot:TRINITY_DN410_c0_g1_i1.p1 TRINITY_DN410_c0_g1~~TRINITY_DN410_c0_g1_i1.p1  ORF type:complete len:310 (-),score=22.64 TRINITY_DN410_c0_g1_i1:143-1072(-)
MPVGRRVSSKEAPGGPGAKKKKRGSGLQWTLAPNGTLDTAARPASKENAVPDFLQEAHIAFRQNNSSCPIGLCIAASCVLTLFAPVTPSRTSPTPCAPDWRFIWTDDELKAAGDFLVEFADAPRGVGAAPAVEAEDVDSSDVEALPPPGRAAAARRAAAAAANAGGAAPPATAGQVAALEWQRYTALFGPHAPADTRYPGAVSYWTDPDVAGTFPTLCRAWKRLGSASPTQAICERCFSVAGCTLTAKRCSLNSETAATCVLARLETDMFFPKKGTPATSVEKWDSASVTSFLRESFRFEDVTSSDEEE